MKPQTAVDTRICTVHRWGLAVKDGRPRLRACTSREPSLEISPTTLLPPWWTPAVVSFYEYENGEGWRSLKITGLPPAAVPNTLATLFALPTFGVSPQDTRGHVHYLALDLDANDPGLLRGLARLFPRGARIWPTHSGRAYHLWCFPSDPLPLPQAKAFTSALAEIIGVFGDVPVELFPAGDGSAPRPLRWPGTISPRTGLPECFVDLRRPRLRDRFDDALILQAIRDGLGRTPSALLVPENLRRPRRAPVVVSVATNAEGVGPGAPQPPNGARTLVDVLLHDPAFVQHVAQKAGTSFNGHGRAVRCFLHLPDNRPSAAWYETPTGWTLHCFHSNLTLGLADVLAYLETRKIHRPKGVARLALIQRAAAEAGLLTTTVERLLQQADAILTSILGTSQDPTTDDHIYTRTSVVGRPEGDPVRRVWEVLADLCRLNAVQGRLTLLAPVREVAARAGLSKEQTCRIINWLCVLGLFDKVHRGPTKAQGLILRCPDAAEVKRRAHLLGSWRSCTRTHVARVLGKDVADAVFLREPDGEQEIQSVGTR